MSDIKNLTSQEQKVAQILKTVIDPEIAVNIIDLGLVYEITKDEDNKTINVVMTLSTRGCPLGDVILENAQVVLESNFPEYKVNVELVWEPVWSPEMITDEGKKAIEQL